MGYIGPAPTSGFISNAKERYTGITTAYVDLNHSISSLADVIVWVNYVKQDATNLTLTSSTRITLGATLVSADIVEVAYLGKAVSTQAPATGQVTNDMLAGSIGLAKLSADDYETGTFTPSMASTGGSFTTVGTCSGYYTKVGKMVQVQMELSLTTVGSGSGNINVTNMPLTSAATGLVHTLMMCRETQTAGVVYDVIMSRDVTTCVILAPAMANGSGYSINGMYRIA